MDDYPVMDPPRTHPRLYSVLGGIAVTVCILAGGVFALAAGASSAPTTPRTADGLPTKEQALQWIAKAEAQVGYRVGDPCPAPDENAPPLGDSPLMGMAGGEPCRIMYWIPAQPDMAAITIDGEGNVSPMITEPRNHVPDTPPTAEVNP